MRPRGEIREGLCAAFKERGASTWRDVLAAVPVCAQARSEVALVQRTVWNMVSSGELSAVGQVKVAGSQRWHALYELACAEPAPEPPNTWETFAELTAAMRLFTSAAHDDGETG